MGMQGFDHLYIETPRFAESLAFWQALGLEILEEWGEDEHRACMLGGPGMRIVLVDDDAPLMNVHLAMAEPETTMKELSAAAVKVTTPLEDTHWGTRWIRLADPDGRTICLEARQPPSA